MDKNIYKYISVLILFIFLFSGCVTSSQPGGKTAQKGGDTSDQKRTKAEGAVLGALLGGALGHVFGGDSKTKGAVIGAVLGAGAGYLVGNEVAKRKKQYASEEEFLEGEIQSAKEYNQTARQYNETLSVQIAELDKTAHELEMRYNVGLASKSDLEKKKAEIQKKLGNSKEFYNNLKKEYDIKLAVLEEQQKKGGGNTEYVAQLEEEIKELKENLDVLNRESTQLAMIDERLTK